MSRLKAITMASCLCLFGALFVPDAKADSWNKRTRITVNHPISVSGNVLQPGNYVMRLMESPSNRHIVQIYTEDEDELVATVQAIPNQRLFPTDRTVLRLDESEIGTPTPVTEWFYPGDKMGQEFLIERGPAVAAVTYEQREVVEIAQATPSPITVPAPQPLPEAAPPPPAPAPEAPPPALPVTGSTLPLVGLAGLLSLGAGALVRRVRK